MYPLKFKPILKTLLWGGDKIIQYKQLSTEQANVGESWELSGVEGDISVVANGEFEGQNLKQLLSQYGTEIVGVRNYERFGNEFPLLIKFIDARQDLSIQVHPNDELAAKRHNSKGKTEMWYVVSADEGAKLCSGFSKSVTPAEYEASVADNKIMEILQQYDIHVGDLFFLPAGRVHSIGAGAFIAEIQQTSDITYRIYDFNRRDANGNLRELHTELAKDAIDYTVEADYRTHYEPKNDAETPLISCPYFTTSLYDLTRNYTLDISARDSFEIVICLEGAAIIVDDEGYEVAVHQGETVLLPASLKSAEIIVDHRCKLLTSHIE